MRKFTLFMMFSLVCFSLYGQIAHEPKIYVAPIEGFGKEADNDYIYKRIIYEIILQYHTVVKLKYDSDYIFKGTIGLTGEMPGDELIVIQQDINSPVPENPVPPISNDFGRREFFSVANGDKFYFFDSTGKNNTPMKPAAKETASLETDDQEKDKGYYLSLEMIDNKTEEVISRQNFIFITADASVNKLISTAVYSLFSDIPDVFPESGDSRDRLLYIETSALWTPRIFYGGYESLNLLGLGVKFGMEFHFLKFMSLGTGAQITWEQVDAPANAITDFLVEVPLSLKLFFKLGNKYALEPYGGASFNYSLENKIQPSIFSWFAGAQFGIKDKKEIGMFVFDARFAMDFANSTIPEENIECQRYNIQLAVGYKFGFVQRKNKVK